MSTLSIRVYFACLVGWLVTRCSGFVHPSHYPTLHHFLYAVAPQLVVDETIESQGRLLDDNEFVRSCQVDETLQNLRTQLPATLLKPLTSTSAEIVYANDVTLVGPHGEELALGYDELIAVSTTLVAASAAARQANAFATSFLVPSDARPRDNVTLVQCAIAMDTTLERFRVQWRTKLPLGEGASQVEGLSELILDDSGRVSIHRLLDLSVDGRNVTAVGETLATLRRAVRSLGDSPFLKSVRDSPLAASLPMLTELRDGFLQQATQTDVEEIQQPPVFVTRTLSSAFLVSATDDMIPIDEMPATKSPPLPGSIQWPSYVASHQVMLQFIQYGLPILSGDGATTKDSVSKLFARNTELRGVDGSIVSTGGERIGEFYRTLASLRKGTYANWEVQQVSTDWTVRCVTVSWVVRSPVKVEGTDRFWLSPSDEEPVIEKIEQVELRVEGNLIDEPEWFRTLWATVERGRSSVGADLLVDLLQQAGRTTVPTTVTTLWTGPPKLNEQAAASIYGILCALHRDFPTLTDAKPKWPPAAEYLAPNVELRGYLNEVLAKGSVAYTQVAAVVTSSIRGALRTGRVTMEAPPSPKIQFMPDGTLRVSVVVKFRVKVAPGEIDTGVPLKLEIVSEYVMNMEGKIKEHRFVESRVNDILTPGDVVSRWIKGTATDTNENNPISLQSVLDAVAWARNLAGGGNR